MLIVIILIVAFTIAAATALFRGLFAFYKDGEILGSDSVEADLRRGTQQNRMMAQRVFFQGLAILAVAVLGAMAA
jgi:Hypoxia induced protein conserved region